MAASGGHWVKGSFIPAEQGAGGLDPFWEAIAGDSPWTEVLHGTSPEAAMSAMRNGINLSTENQYGFEDDRPPSVYLTDDDYQAIAYAEGKSEPDGNMGFVTVRVPKDAYAEMKLDELDHEQLGQDANFRIERSIPADWISRVVVTDQGGKVIRDLQIKPGAR